VRVEVGRVVEAADGDPLLFDDDVTDRRVVGADERKAPSARRARQDLADDPAVRYDNY